MRPARVSRGLSGRAVVDAHAAPDEEREQTRGGEHDRTDRDRRTLGATEPVDEQHDAPSASAATTTRRRTAATTSG